MPTLAKLLQRNRDWAERVERDDPGFFHRLSDHQEPDHLWIGCSDSRVPAGQILDLKPGEIFEHRNIGNIVFPDDPNFLAVLHFAVVELRVGHIMVAGHYGCGGMRAALEAPGDGPVAEWLREARALAARHAAELGALPHAARADRLSEINVLAQAENLRHCSILREAWARGQSIEVHAWIYRLDDGRLRPLREVIRGPDD